MVRICLDVLFDRRVLGGDELGGAPGGRRVVGVAGLDDGRLVDRRAHEYVPVVLRGGVYSRRPPAGGDGLAVTGVIWAGQRW